MKVSWTPKPMKSLFIIEYTQEAVAEIPSFSDNKVNLHCLETVNIKC